MSGVNTYNDPNHPVEIYYGQPQFHDLKSMLVNLGVTAYPEDKVATVPEPDLGLGSQITIIRATKINIIDAKKNYTYQTWKISISDLLKEKGIELLGQDSVTPDISSKLIYNMNIIITRVAEVEVTETEKIDFKVINKNSVDLEKGQTEIDTKGVNGEKQVKYLVKRVDGVEVSRSIIDTNITKQAVNQIVIVGIGPKLAKSGPYLSDINGAAKKYLINGTALSCLMIKESNGNVGSVNPDGPWYGLFQYTESLWGTVSSKAGYGGSSWSNATAQIYSTAWALTHGYASRWSGTWPKCANK